MRRTEGKVTNWINLPKRCPLNLGRSFVSFDIRLLKVELRGAPIQLCLIVYVCARTAAAAGQGSSGWTTRGRHRARHQRFQLPNNESLGGNGPPWERHSINWTDRLQVRHRQLSRGKVGVLMDVDSVGCWTKLIRFTLTSLTCDFIARRVLLLKTDEYSWLVTDTGLSVPTWQEFNVFRDLFRFIRCRDGEGSAVLF
jgi:hypothetical protein